MVKKMKKVAKRARSPSGADDLADAPIQDHSPTTTASATAKHTKEEAEAESTPPPPPPESMVGNFQLKRTTTDKKMTNRQKCLVLGGRNMSSKDRHLLRDLIGLMPHAREHAKMGRTNRLGDDLVEISSLHQCNSVMFLEPHRNDVTYVWIAQSPNGPSIKFQLTNVHTADEMRMAGNCLKYSRPLLHFDRDFETQPHLRVVRSLLHMAFNTPRYHPKSKPFVDRVMSFFWLDGHIWVRNYQIVPGQQKPSLMEIGPRFTLEPVLILNGCCKGSVLWRSDAAKAPTEQRRTRKMRRLEKQQANEAVKAKSDKHKALYPQAPVNPLDLVFKD